jgi:hypothetical protein
MAWKGTLQCLSGKAGREIDGQLRESIVLSFGLQAQAGHDHVALALTSRRGRSFDELLALFK